jgi:serine/threonine protein kinase
VFLEARKGRRELVRMMHEAAADTSLDAGSLRAPGPRFKIEHEGNFDFVKVLDFGVAKIVANEDLACAGTVAGTIFGTPEYMAPEAARGEPVTPAVDIYALGILFYEMLTGHLPFEANSAVEVLSMQITRMPKRPSEVGAGDVTPQAERLILRCLDKDPTRRPRSMTEVRAELQECYGSVRFLRDADRIPGAGEAGLRPKSKGKRDSDPPKRERITDEIRDLLMAGGLGPAGPADVPEGEQPPRLGETSRVTDELKDLFLVRPPAPDLPKLGGSGQNDVPVLLTNVKAPGPGAPSSGGEVPLPTKKPRHGER